MHKLSLWSNFFYGLSAEESLREISKAGFEFTELSDNHFSELIKNPGRKAQPGYNDIKPLQLHAPICSCFVPENAPTAERLVDLAGPDKELLQREINLLKDWCSECAGMSIPVIVVHPGGVNGWESRTGFERLFELNYRAFSELSEAGRAQRVKFAVENMGRGPGARLSFGAKGEEILELVRKVDSGSVGICLDTSHANTVEGFDTPGFIKEAGDKLFATHLSDNLGKEDDHLMLFSGTVKWPEIFKALKDINYEGLLNLEIPGENKCPEGIRRIKAKYAFEILKHSAKCNEQEELPDSEKRLDILDKIRSKLLDVSPEEVEIDVERTIQAVRKRQV